MLSLTKPGKLQTMVEDYPPRSRRSGLLKLSTELGQMDQLAVVKCHALVNSDVTVKVTVAECDSPQQPPLVTSFPIIVVVYAVATVPFGRAAFDFFPVAT